MIAALLVIVGLQVGPLIYASSTGEIGPITDWAGLAGYVLGGAALSMLVGCLAFLFRRGRGLIFFVIAVGLFVVSRIGLLLG